MKNLCNSTLRCLSQSLYSVLYKNVLLCSVFVVIVFSFTGCKKEIINPPDMVQSLTSQTVDSKNNVIKNYNGLSLQTIGELVQARAATARYRNIKNAINDGYADIAVDVEGMGHHFMKTSIVDGKFDISEPEILVYNRNDEGTQELVAVEYAVPLTYPKPEGFTGSSDEWNGTSGFPFWLLHAWVWAYNPDGVFKWTNAQVHLH